MGASCPMKRQVLGFSISFHFHFITLFTIGEIYSESISFSFLMYIIFVRKVLGHLYLWYIYVISIFLFYISKLSKHAVVHGTEATGLYL